NFRHINFLDTFDVVAKLHKLSPHTWKGMTYRGEIGDSRLPARSMALRGHENPTLESWLEDRPVKDFDALAGWHSLQALLAEARKAILADPVVKANNFLDPDLPIGRVMISGLEPQGVITWHTDNGAYHDRHARFHIPLVTNPGCLMYSGPEAVHMNVGELRLF